MGLANSRRRKVKAVSAIVRSRKLGESHEGGRPSSAMLRLRVGHLARPIPRQVVKSLGPRGGMRSPRGAPHDMHGSFPTGAGSVPITGHETLAGPGSPGVRLWSRFASEARNWGFRPNVLVLIMDSSQATGLSQTGQEWRNPEGTAMADQKHNG